MTWLVNLHGTLNPVYSRLEVKVFYDDIHDNIKEGGQITREHVHTILVRNKNRARRTKIKEVYEVCKQHCCDKEAERICADLQSYSNF